MLVGKALVVIPMAMVAEHFDHLASRTFLIHAMLERGIFRFRPLLGAPEETVPAVHRRKRNRAPDALLRY